MKININMMKISDELGENNRSNRKIIDSAYNYKYINRLRPKFADKQ